MAFHFGAEWQQRTAFVSQRLPIRLSEQIKISFLLKRIEKGEPGVNIKRPTASSGARDDIEAIYFPS